MVNATAAVRIGRLEHMVDGLRAQLLTTPTNQRAAVEGTLDAVTRSIAALRDGTTATSLILHDRRQTPRRIPKPARRRRFVFPVDERPVQRPVVEAAVDGGPRQDAPPPGSECVLPMPAAYEKYKPALDSELDVVTVWTPHRDAPSLIGNRPTHAPILPARTPSVMR